MQQEPVSSLRLRDPVVVHAGTLLRAAIADMRTHSLGCAVVVDYAQRPVGIFTERSVIDALIDGADLDSRPVGDFVASSFASVRCSDPISRVWEAIQDRLDRFVCVTDDAGNLMGVTGQRGIAEYLAEHFAGLVTVQRLGCTPWMPQREGA